MAVPVLIPKATITLEEANVLCWRKREGEQVRKDEPLFEMETDKVVVEVPSPADGLLLRIDVEQGMAKVDGAIGWIGTAGELLPDAVSPPNPNRAETISPGPVQAPVAPEEGGFVPASPAARRRARELGLDLTRITGTGPGGRITESDVERAEPRR